MVSTARRSAQFHSSSPRPHGGVPSSGSSKAGGGAVLSIRSLAKTYDGPRRRQVLCNVNLELKPGEYVAIMGESGIGKSTLLNLIAGLDRPDAGTIAVDGVDLGGLSDEDMTKLRRRRMGFVFQAFHLLPYLNVIQNVALPLSLNRTPRAEVSATVRAMLEAVGLGERGTSMPRELSGGELQRVAIARALVHRPGLLLADEPTGNLDQDNAAQVLALLRAQVKTSDAAAILVTHSLAAAQTTDRVYWLTAAGIQVAPTSSA
jgi:putative ABC transport system ATP-binding protein